MSSPAILASQARYQVKASLRAGATLALGIVLPVFFYTGFTLLFTGDAMGGGYPVDLRDVGDISLKSFYAGGMMAWGVIYGAFAGLVPELVGLRESGTLKRFRGTPMPLWTFIASRFLVALIVALLGTAALVLIAWFGFGQELRDGAIVGLVIYTAAGTFTWTCLSFAATTITRSQNGAQALSNAVALTLAMISGVLFATGFLPDWLVKIVQWLPLEPLANGFQSLYSADVTGLGSNDVGNLAILAGWAVIGAVVALLFFRWDPKQRRG